MRIYLPDTKYKNGEAVNYNFEENLAACFNDFSEGSTLQLLVSVTGSADKVLVSGDLEASVEETCSRCLVTFNRTFQTDFTEAFTVTGETTAESPEERAEETANMLTVTGDYLYLDEYIRQLVILAREHSPICRPDCKGICPGCGTDLNVSTCSCDTGDEQVDIRLLKLKELKQGS